MARILAAKNFRDRPLDISMLLDEDNRVASR